MAGVEGWQGRRDSGFGDCALNFDWLLCTGKVGNWIDFSVAKRRRLGTSLRPTGWRAASLRRSRIFSGFSIQISDRLLYRSRW